VTLGTIADIVPLVEENRVLVKFGLRELTQTGSPGLVALKAVSSVSDVSTGVVGFRLAPRLNAGGRLADAARSVELLTTDDPARAQQLAAELDQENRARQAIELEILDDAIRRLDNDPDFAHRRSIVLASDDWHPGVIGIVASRLIERYYRPTVLLAIDSTSGMGRGSGRSIRGLNLYEAFKACSHCLEGFGGHRMAAGLSIRAERVAAFSEQFEATVRAMTRPEDFVQETRIDAELSFAEINDALLEDLSRLEPHGQGNPEPVFLARGVTVVSHRIVGENHLKLYLRHGHRALSAIGFGMADNPIEADAALDILFSPEHNEWKGNTSIQLRLRDFRRTANTLPAAAEAPVP
jgi:single-stranded-DNA-specific exonuclease